MRNSAVNLFLWFRKLLSIFNLVVGRKKYIIKIVICLLFLSVFVIMQSYAGTWRDLFDGKILNGWERGLEVNRWSATWKTENGLLSARIEKPEQWFIRAADFLLWNAHKFKLNRLVVVGEGIHNGRFPDDIKGQLCLFLGKRRPSPDYAEGYIFTPTYTETTAFSEKGVYQTGDIKASYSDRFQLTSKHLKVVFDKGKFQLWTHDILLTEFFDDFEIDFIDVVGLIVWHVGMEVWSTASISTFSISGRDIPNHNSLDVQLRSTQLTTTWGKLKRL